MRRLLLSVLGVVLATSTLSGPSASAEPAHPRAAAKKLVTLTASSTDRVGGQRLVLKGKVRTERGVKRLVHLHAKALGEWDTVSQTRTSRNGAYRFVLTSPNPAAAPVRLGFRVEAVASTSKKLRKAWRKKARSAAVRITFRNNPAIAQASYDVADPVACDSGTPGVMAQTAACVAASEAQHMERMWLDVRLMDRRERDLDLLLQLGVELQALPASDQLAYLRLLLPHTSPALLESDLGGDEQAVEMALFAFFWIGGAIQDELQAIDPAARSATAWKPAWTEHFIVKDLSKVVVSGDTATTPERTFEAAGNGRLTVGGSWKYVGGRWYSAFDPTVLEKLS